MEENASKHARQANTLLTSKVMNRSDEAALYVRKLTVIDANRKSSDSVESTLLTVAL